MFPVLLATTGVLAIGIGTTTRKIRELPFSAPLLALVAGLLIGPVGLGAAELPADQHHRVVEIATELLLAVALMGIALRYPRWTARARLAPVTLLLVLVMPLMAVTTSVLAGTTLSLSVGLAAAVGAALTPTDPVLASSVVTGEPAERDIPARLRQLLSLESGANDGLALPLALAAGALAVSTSAWAGLGRGLAEVLWGALLGGALGLAAGKLMHRERRERDMDPASVTLFAIVLAVAVLGTVSLAGGNGVLGVFAAGLAYNRVVTDPERAAEEEIDEGLNQFLVLPVFVLFGVVAPWNGWLELGWAGLGFAAAVLVLRRLPWVLLLARPLRLRLVDAVWLGWFGPMGVAALYYLALLHSLGVTSPAVWHAGTLAVAASTVLHGITSAPGRRAYVRWARAAPSRGDAAHGNGPPRASSTA